MLVVMGGLPGVGKSAVADRLGVDLPAVVLSVDPIEDAIVRAGVNRSFTTGLAAYEVAAAIATHQLTLGHNVIADAANYVEAGRAFWRRVAARCDTQLRVIHLICSDETEHRRRLETRDRGLRGIAEPMWLDVVRRAEETEPWDEPHLVLDTLAPLEAILATALRHIRSPNT